MYYEDMDYKEAAMEVERLYKETGITAKVHGWVPMVRYENSINYDWPRLHFTIIFYDKDGYAKEVVEYSMGLGLFKLPSKITPRLWGFTDDNEAMFHAMKEKPYADFKNKQLQAETVAKVAKFTNQGPNVAQVLSCVCSEGLEAASYQSFENWASNLGYNEDSREAERVYNKCKEQYYKVNKLLTQEQIERFAELNSML